MRTQEIVEAYGKTHIYMIGMDDNPQPKHIEVIIKNVKHDNIFSGGKRHYEIVKPFLPADAVWIEIKAPINAVLTEYSRLIQEGKVIVSFVSGDPFFFGFASTIRKNLLGVGMKVFPYFNSLQMFAHHEQIPYENMHAVSVTGRPWHELDRALLEYRPLIGVLTDRVHTPRAIAKRMMEYHLDRDYTMWVAEHLGNPKKEKIYKIYSIEEISEMSFTNPNCVLLMKAPNCALQRPALGIPDTKFILLNDRTKMITKPVRTA
jgi:precorrin-6Y C5,15-methyltransferase (decarboxylating)